MAYESPWSRLSRVYEEESERRAARAATSPTTRLADTYRRATSGASGGVSGGGYFAGIEDAPLWARTPLVTSRAISGLLEPVQAPKDFFDAIVAGGLDPDSTITERLRRLQPATYAPFGATPPRATTGAEVVGLLGVEDEAARRWGGVVFDLVADPLLAGSWLRAGGALTRSQSLTQLGRRVDTATSLAGINRGLNTVVPAKRWVDRRATEVLDSFANRRVPWGRGDGGDRTWGDFTRSRTAALEQQMPFSRYTPTGQGVRPTSAAEPAFGRRVYAAQQLSRQGARNVAERSVDLIQRAEAGVLGDQATSWLGRAADILSRGRRRAERAADGMPAILRDAIYATGYDLADSVGFAARRPSFQTEVSSELTSAFAGRGLGRMTKPQRDLVSLSRQRVAEVARRNNYDPQEAIRRFDQFVGRIQEADALLGYHLSGYEFVRGRFYESVAGAGANPGIGMAMWDDALRRGVRGEDVLGSTRLAGRELSSVFGEDIRTLGDLVGPETNMRGLNLNDYLRGLQEGHMRRSFGLFQDQASFDNWMTNLRTGKVLPNNIIDDTHLQRALGADTPELRAFQEYVNAVSPGTRDRGVVLRQSAVMEGLRDYLIRNEGVGATEATRRAQESMGKLVKELQAGGDSSPIARIVDQVTELAKKYEQDPTRSSRGGVGKAMFREREDLARDVLEQLGELSLPQASLREGAQAARTQVAWADYVSTVYREARDAGYVRSSKATVGGTKFVPLGEQPELYGPLAGKYVHPMLKKELMTAARERAKGGNYGSRLRALITGGYLASPNVITANIFGGLYTTGLLGENPAHMIRNMGANYREFQKASRDPNYTFRALDDLKQHIGIDDTSLVHADIERAFRTVKAAPELGTQGLRKVFEDTTNVIQGQLNAPLGQKWAGLDGFQFAENWMKVSAFTARRRTLANRLGVDLGEFNKPRAQRSQRALDIDKEAAEFARVSVFDYAELPDSLRLLRDAGLMLFPGFTYFLTARTLKTAFQRPGRLAFADRIAEGINNAQMEEDDKLAVWASLPDWLREEQGVVMPFLTRTDENGDVRRSVIPLNQIIPTETLAGNPWGESLASVGIYKPFIELFSAHFITRDGEAVFSAQYGQQVFDPTEDAATRVGQSLGYLANSLMPGVLRKGVTYTPGEGVSGLVPTVMSMGVEMDGPLADSIYSLWEYENRRAERTVWDQVVAATIRSPQVITTSGPLANYRKNLESSEYELSQTISTLQERAERAMMRGDYDLARRLQERIVRERREWMERMRPMLEAVRAAQD